jgi:hypothetical protein
VCSGRFSNRPYRGSNLVASAFSRPAPSSPVASAFRRNVLIAALAATLASTVSAAAQDPRWELEGYGGIVAARTAGEGTRTLPPAGAPLVTSSPTFPTHQVPSWLFGDGAALLNGVNAEFGVAARIVPLDAAFSPLLSSRVPVAGARVRRRLNDRLSLEIGVDALTRSEDRSSGLTAAVESTRASFRTAFAGLLGSGPFLGVTVDATAATASEVRRRELATTGAIVARFTPWGAFVPYATFGGGVVTGSGTLPSATLEGRYRFAILGEVPIDETDRVSLRYSRRAAFVAVLGGGLQRALSSRWSVRVDARMLLGPDTTRVVIDATPTSSRTGPSGFVESFTNPAVQFSNDPATGRRSTLSEPSLSGVEVFSGSLQTRTLVTFGLVRRF